MSALVPAAVLFDLDGTLVDTAPDMAGALNDLRRRRALDALPYATLRPLVSHGSRALVERGLAPADEAQMMASIEEFLDTYGRRVARESTLFEGMDALLIALEASAVPWGVVTNKPGALSAALMDQLALAQRCGVLIGGDTLRQRKPHPMPLLHAADALGVAANRCLYVGDAARDINAGRAAGMTTVAAAYGYILHDDRVDGWGADYIVHGVDELRQLIAGCFTHRDAAPNHAGH